MPNTPTPARPALDASELADTIERLSNDATSAPWFVLWDEEHPWDVQLAADEAGENRVAFMAHNNGRDDNRDGATATLICILRNNAPALVAALRSLADMRGALEKAPIPSKYHGQRGFELERFLADYETFVRDKLAALARSAP